MIWVAFVGFIWKPSITNTKYTGVLWTPFLRQRDPERPFWGETIPLPTRGPGRPFRFFWFYSSSKRSYCTKRWKWCTRLQWRTLWRSPWSLYYKKDSMGALHFHCFSQHGTETQTTEMKGWNLICPRIENNFALLSHLGPFVISWRMR